MKMVQCYDIFKSIEGELKFTGDCEKDRLIARRIQNYYQLINAALSDLIELADNDNKSIDDGATQAIAASAIKDIYSKIPDKFKK